MQVILLILFIVAGQSRVQQVGIVPDMQTCEKTAHQINTSKMPKEVNHQQLDGMGAICMRIKPPGKDT